jgi:hypothetical protein
MTDSRQDIVRGLMVAIGACLVLAGPADAQRGHRRDRQAGAETPATGDTLTSAEDGQTVYDSKLNVTWLADANYAHSQHYGVDGITSSGAMSYTAAVAWVKALNKANYLGHHTWTLPATPKQDNTCAKNGPQGNGFGFGCHGGDLGSLYYNGLALRYPNTAVSRPPGSDAGGFKNFQNYLYWSFDNSGHTGATKGVNKNEYASFSFTAGYKGSNVNPDYLYVLPMIPGDPAGAFPPGSVVYDSVNKITWLADANLAHSVSFGVDANADGAMTHDAAVQMVANMNGQHYLGHTGWQLPSTPADDPSCSIRNKVPTYAFNCTGGDMGKLYYGFLHKTAGEAVVSPLEAETSPFRNIQPYLYWSCLGPTQPPLRVNPEQPARGAGGRRHRNQPADDNEGGASQSGGDADGGSACGQEPAAADFQFSFSLGSGFQGTDILENDLYVMVYYPGPPPGLSGKKAPPSGGVKCTYGKACTNPTM